MSALFIIISVILLANAYPLIVDILKINKSLLQFTITYVFVEIAAAVILAYTSGNNFSNIEILILSIALIGVIVRVGVYYFRKTKIISTR